PPRPRTGQRRPRRAGGDGPQGAGGAQAEAVPARGGETPPGTRPGHRAPAVLLRAEGERAGGPGHGGRAAVGSQGRVIVRAGKNDASRTVPLADASAREAVAEWKRERAAWPGAESGALLLNRRGGRLADRAVNLLLDELAADADLVDENGHPALSAHTLRHTFGTNLTRSWVGVATVARLRIHKRLETTRRYTLPTQADMEAAVAQLPTDE